jgi:hypothetical protein
MIDMRPQSVSGRFRECRNQPTRRGRNRSFARRGDVNHLKRGIEEEYSMKTDPKVTKQQVLDWCPQPRGLQEPGNHSEIPAMRYENAGSVGKDKENRDLSKKIIAAFKEGKPSGRFVLQWRMFPNAAHPDANKPDGCGCGCSCGCG